MRSKDIYKQLVPGIFVGFLLGFVINFLAGVNTVNPVPNMIGIVLSCTVPVALNGVIILMGTAKFLDRKLSVGEAFKRNSVYILLGTFIGFFYMVGMLNCGVDLTQVNEMTNTINNALLGVAVSTVLGYFTIKDYAEDVKYTRRDKKKK